MGNQTFCNCITCHHKKEKSIDIEKIIKNVERGTNRESVNISNRQNINKKNYINNDQIMTNCVSLKKTISNHSYIEKEIKNCKLNKNEPLNKSDENKDCKLNNNIHLNINNNINIDNNSSLNINVKKSKSKQSLPIAFDNKEDVIKSYVYHDPCLSFVKISKKKVKH